MPQYSFTGDPAADAAILANLQGQYGNLYNRQKSRLAEHLASRGFLGGGMEEKGVEELLGQQGELMGQAALASQVAQAQRYHQQKQKEQDVQDQMRLMEYESRLKRKKKLSALQQAIMGLGQGAATGAAVGSLSANPAGIGIGAGIGGGLGLLGGLAGIYGEGDY